MIGRYQVMIGVVSGCILIVFGLVPGLFQDLADGVRRYSDSFTAGFPTSPRLYTPIRRPRWLAGLGFLLIVLTIVAYLLPMGS